MAEIRTTSSTGAEKGVKPHQFNMIPPIPVKELAQLYGRGARKYAERNWERGYEHSKSYAGLQRHANLFWSGESIDLELNINHMVSVAWHATVLLTFTETHPEFDDRPFSERDISKDSTPFGKIVEPDISVRHIDDNEDTRDGVPEARFDLVPQFPLAELARFYGEGIAEPVKLEGRRWSDAYARLQEHAHLFWSGEDYTASGFHHMTYVLHYAFMMIDLYNRFPEFDDRLAQGAAPIGFDSMPTI